MAGGQAQRCDDRQGQGRSTQGHQRVVDDELEPVEPVELDAPPIDGDAVELVVSLPDVLPVELPDVEPVPVAPIELVPPVPLVPGEVLALPLREPEPVVVDGDVDAVDELVDGVEPGVVVLLVVDEVVLDSRFVHAPSERAATTASTPAVTWVRVIFIRELLEGSRIAYGKGQPGRPAPTLGSRRLRCVGTGCFSV